jgi:cis-3-alkyl-4-acyloxetan-2-one decarboxylase
MYTGSYMNSRFITALIHRYLRVPYILHVRENRRGKDSQVTILFLHGLGDTGKTWEPIIKELPREYRIITVDLLGFGKSPKPGWAKLDTRMQARSIGATLVRLGTIGPVIVVGHSMGALVATEIARRHPRIVRGLILCSPPFYKSPRAKLRLLSRDEQLRKLYRRATKNPVHFIKLSALAMRVRLIGATHEITEENIHTYISALESSIINQSSLDDAKKLKQPVRVLHGIFDPVVVGANLREVARTNPKVSMRHIVASHEIKGNYRKEVIAAIKEMMRYKRLNVGCVQAFLQAFHDRHVG